MLTLDYEHAYLEGKDIIVPSMKQPSTRLRISEDRTSMIVEHEYCDCYVHNGEELTEWSWHKASCQMNEREMMTIKKELCQYAENEKVCLSRKVC